MAVLYAKDSPLVFQGLCDTVLMSEIMIVIFFSSIVFSSLSTIVLFISLSAIVLDCQCPTGYTGELCETDLNACELVANPCYPGVLCVDDPAPADHEGYS